MIPSLIQRSKSFTNTGTNSSISSAGISGAISPQNKCSFKKYHVEDKYSQKKFNVEDTGSPANILINNVMPLISVDFAGNCLNFLIEILGFYVIFLIPLIWTPQIKNYYGFEDHVVEYYFKISRKLKVKCNFADLFFVIFIIQLFSLNINLNIADIPQLPEVLMKILSIIGVLSFVILKNYESNLSPLTKITYDRDNFTRAFLHNILLLSHVIVLFLMLFCSFYTTWDTILNVKEFFYIVSSLDFNTLSFYSVFFLNIYILYKIIANAIIKEWRLTYIHFKQSTLVNVTHKTLFNLFFQDGLSSTASRIRYQLHTNKLFYKLYDYLQKKNFGFKGVYLDPSYSFFNFFMLVVILLEYTFNNGILQLFFFIFPFYVVIQLIIEIQKTLAIFFESSGEISLIIDTISVYTYDTYKSHSHILLLPEALSKLPEPEARLGYSAYTLYQDLDWIDLEFYFPYIYFGRCIRRQLPEDTQQLGYAGEGCLIQNFANFFEQNFVFEYDHEEENACIFICRAFNSLMFCSSRAQCKEIKYNIYTAYYNEKTKEYSFVFCNAALTLEEQDYHEGDDDEMLWVIPTNKKKLEEKDKEPVRYLYMGGIPLIVKEDFFKRMASFGIDKDHVLTLQRDSICRGAVSFLETVGLRDSPSNKEQLLDLYTKAILESRAIDINTTRIFFCSFYKGFHYLTYKPKDIEDAYVRFGRNIGPFEFATNKPFRKLDFIHELRGATDLQAILKRTKSFSHLTVVEGREFNDFTIKNGATSIIDLDQKTSETHIGYDRRKNQIYIVRPLSYEEDDGLINPVMKYDNHSNNPMTPENYYYQEQLDNINNACNAAKDAGDKDAEKALKELMFNTLQKNTFKKNPMPMAELLNAQP